MRQVLFELFQPRGRVSAVTVRILVGLSFTSLLLAVSAYFAFDGGHRIAAVTAFTLMSLGNLLQALGSVLPEERGGKLARLAAFPVAMMMCVALAVTLLFQSGIW
jgi:hypothetical protein